MKKIRHMAIVAIAAMAISSCDDETLTIGHSLTNEHDKLVTDATIFNVSTRTVMADSVLSLSNKCYLGKVRDPETGADVTSEFTTQFHLLETTYISPDEKVASRYNGLAAADSCDIVLYLDSPFKNQDSLTAMKMQVLELNKPMEEGRRYYSNFDPIAQNLVREGAPLRSKVFTYRNMTDTDSARNSSTYMENIRITLNQPYTATNGTTYNNYGTYIMRQYHEHPEYFRNSYVFTHNVCPGFFFNITDGLGFHSSISNIGLRIFYRLVTDSTDVRASLVLAGTKEVLQTTHVTNDMGALQKLAAETQHTYLKSPAGLYTEVTLPVEEIMSQHKNDSLIAAKIIFLRLNNQSVDPRMLATPKTLLMVQSDSLHTFFEKNELPDNKTSYYTTFSSTNNTYEFSNISNLVKTLWTYYQEGISRNANWAAEHPNWNKVLLVPITKTSYSTSTGTTVTGVEHDMSLTSTRLVGGTQNPNAPVQISVMYANYKQ